MSVSGLKRGGCEGLIICLSFLIEKLALLFELVVECSRFGCCELGGRRGTPVEAEWCRGLGGLSLCVGEQLVDGFRLKSSRVLLAFSFELTSFDCKTGLLPNPLVKQARLQHLWTRWDERPPCSGSTEWSVCLLRAFSTRRHQHPMCVCSRSLSCAAFFSAFRLHRFWNARQASLKEID